MSLDLLQRTRTRTRPAQRPVETVHRRMPSWRRFWPVPLIAMLMVLRLFLPGTAQADVRGLPTDPIRTSAVEAIRQDFADPTVLVVGGVYYAYATNAADLNIQLMTSTDLKNWSSPVDALPTLPAWAQVGRTWAPSVVAADGVYRMYYSPEQDSSGRECISVATAARPQGPFVDNSSAPLMCQLDRGGSIDPYVFTDNGGTYLIWKSEDNAFGKPTNIWSEQLDPVTGGFVAGSTAVRLLTAAAHWQQPSLEGPAMIVHDGVHYLFYGANAWNTDHSGIGYATCSSAQGPCVDRTTKGPWLSGTGSSGSPTGPQGPDFFTDDTGQTRMAFAGWVGGVGYQSVGVRALWTEPLKFPATPGG